MSLWCKRQRARAVPLFLLAALGSSCQTIEVSQPPIQVETSASYKAPVAKRGAVSSTWWRRFNDPELNRLQRSIPRQNQSLAAAYARYQQSLAALGISRANLYPRVDGEASITRSRLSQNGQFGGIGDNYLTLYSVGAQLGYEVDLWGRVRAIVQNSTALAQNADFQVSDTLLSLQTQLAANYFALRFLDSEAAVLRKAVETRQETLDLANLRLEAGFTSALDASRARTLLADAQAELRSIAGPRAQLENAIAVLAGRNASNFSIAARAYNGTIPTVPVSSQGALLSRRPDLAAAERRLAASSARIGIAKADFYPRLQLTGAAGLSSIDRRTFLEATSRTFSFGPNVTLPLFRGGELKANLAQARAEQKEALHAFQNNALQAFAEVESALASLAALKSEAEARSRSLSSAQKSFELADLRYREGTDSYLNVVDAQRELLTAQRANVRTRGRRFSSTIELYRALGGGFDRLPRK